MAYCRVCGFWKGSGCECRTEKETLGQEEETRSNGAVLLLILLVIGFIISWLILN